MASVLELFLLFGAERPQRWRAILVVILEWLSFPPEALHLMHIRAETQFACLLTNKCVTDNDKGLL